MQQKIKKKYAFKNNNNNNNDNNNTSRTITLYVQYNALVGITYIYASAKNKRELVK